MSLKSEFKPPVYPESPYASDPDFTRASEWLQRSHPHPAVRLLGVPFSELSLSGARCELLPGAVREAMSSFSTFSPTLGVELTSAGVEDLGDIDFTSLSGEAALAAIGSVCSELAPGPPVAIVGGDNSVMAPAAQSFVGAGGGLITLDAHHDVRDYVRDGISNGSPVRQLIDSGLPGSRITQIGIKDFANSEAYASYAAAQGIEVIPLPQVREEGVEGQILAALDRLADGPIYVDVDIDVVDRALAPGAPAAQPGGLHPSQVSLAAYLCGKHPSVKALDVVEVDPTRDINATTVRLAALVILSFMAGVISR